MSYFDRIWEELNNRDLPFVTEKLKAADNVFEGVVNRLKGLERAIEIYEETGIGPEVDFGNPEVIFQEPNEQVKTLHSPKRSSLKENIQPQTDTSGESSASRTRPRRNAFKEAALNINHQSNISLSTKLRRSNRSNAVLQNVYVKKEPEDTVKIKTEQEEMPAPTRPAPRRKKPKKSEMKTAVVKVERIDEDSREEDERDSDVIVLESNTATVDLLDSDDPDKTVKSEEAFEKKKKEKRTLGKRTRTHSSDEESRSNKEKRSKSKSDEDNYEDAASTVETDKDVANATFVMEKLAVNPANTTVVVTNSKLCPATAEDLMTDDESEDEKNRKKSPPKTITKKKQVFSAFESSPVKKKIEAFEKLREEAGDTVRVTRTKTRAQAKGQEEENKEEGECRSVVKEKAKLFTPLPTKFLPASTSTTTKSNKYVTPTKLNDASMNKLTSSMKVSQAEYKERERKRKEKEEEAMRKREALIQAQIEEKKRKREEKLLKVQQQREALEKQKQKTVEAQRLKDERHRQLLAEQEERKRQQRDEADRKRLLAKQKAAEEKKRQDEQAAQRHRAPRDQQRQLPEYMRSKPPRMPTPDCYDSDEEEERPRRGPETWDAALDVAKLEVCMLAAGEAVKNSFFSRGAVTPDLVEIFEVIDSRKLKRTSSAVWTKPPRYTMLPDLDEED